MKKQLLFGFGAAALLASCSSDIESPVASDDASYLRINATIDEIRTRVTDNAFDNNDEIGISFSENGDENVKYTFLNSSFSADSPLKIKDAATVVAYYPYVADTDFDMINGWDRSVVDKNNAPLPATQIDYLFAKANVTKDNPVADFTFIHKMAQIAITVNDKTDKSEYKDANYSLTLNNVAVDFNFCPFDGLVTPEDQDGTIKVASATVGKTQTIIVPSMQAPLEDPIEVLITIDGKSFKTNIEPALKPGNRYIYTLNVKDSASSLEVSDDISGWQDNDEGEQDMEETEAPYELSVGDFLLQDGNTVAATTANAEANSGKIVGVVYYVGNDGLDNFGYTVKKGLALAINDAGQARWGSGNTDYSTWGTDEEKGHPDHLGNLSVNEMSVGGNGPKTNQMMGYNNTQIVIKAQQDFLDDDKDANNEGKYTHSQELLDLLEAANNTTVSGASSWYLPNFSEYYEITKNLSTINKSIKAAGGTELVPFTGTFDNKSSNDTFTTEGYYWTSTLRGASNGWVHLLDATGQDDTETLKTWSITRNSTSTKGYFRFAIAF